MSKTVLGYDEVESLATRVATLGCESNELMNDLEEYLASDRITAEALSDISSEIKSESDSLDYSDILRRLNEKIEELKN